MNPHHAAKSHRTSNLLRLLTATLTAIVMAATLACSSEELPPTHRPQKSNPGPMRTIEAMASEMATLKTKVADLSETAPIVTLLQGQETLGNNTVTLNVLTGHKPVIINFWASESPPTRAEIPEFQAFYEEHKDQVLVLLVDAGLLTNQGTLGQALDLLKELGITIPAGYAENPAML